MFQNLVGVLMAGTTPGGAYQPVSGGNGWDLTSFLTNLQGQGMGWLSGIVTLIGLVLLGVGVYKGAKGLMSRNNGQTSWPMVILMIVLGVLLLTTGVGGIMKLGQFGIDTVGGLGGNP